MKKIHLQGTLKLLNNNKNIIKIELSVVVTKVVSSEVKPMNGIKENLEGFGGTKGTDKASSLIATILL